MQWYYTFQGQRQGPVDDAGLEDLVSQGVIRDDTHVWREGLAEWQLYGAVKPKPMSAPTPVPTPASSPKPIETPIESGVGGGGDLERHHRPRPTPNVPMFRQLMSRLPESSDRLRPSTKATCFITPCCARSATGGLSGLA